MDGIQILNHIPELAAWGIGTAVGLVMVRRSGTKAEKLFLAGCSLMFLAGIISLSLGSAISWLKEQRISAQEFGFIMSSSGPPALAGLVCLVIAFWSRFRVNRQEPLS
jgi:hypothetical protein